MMLKWVVLAVVMFVGAWVLFTVVPPSAVLRAAGTEAPVVASLDNSIARPVLRAREYADNAGGGAVGTGETVTFAADLSGRARIIDGDSIAIGDTRIRLHGIDAPESGQSCLAGGTRWACGERATQALAAYIDGGPVKCEEQDRDRYGRIVAVCQHAGRDVNAWLVREGWALAYRRYSRAYVDEEAAAKSARRGIWRGEFVPPWDWRRGERLATHDDAATDHVPSGCNIKGNISRNGERIYHMPEDRYYDRTRISPSQGERWFCSESDAQAAGWRRARR